MKGRTARDLALGSTLLAAAIGASALRARATEQLVASQTYEDVYYLPPPDWLPALSLGHREALADLLWMRALVYFGSEMVERGALAHVYDYTEAMLALDPDFRAVYRWIGTAGVYRPGAITAGDVEGAVEIMRRGMERAPDDGQLAWILGATLAFELPPLLDDDAERDAARAEGADYIAIATRLGAAPQWAVLSSATILQRVGRAESAVRHLEDMYAMVSDPSLRAEIEAGIAAMRDQAYAEAFVEASRDEERRWLRDMPYVDRDLYFLLGEAPGDDWRSSFREGFAAGALDEPEAAVEP